SSTWPGGHADHRKPSRDIAEDCRSGTDLHIVAQVDPLADHGTTAHENPVAREDFSADRGVGHHAGMIAECRVMADGGVEGNESMNPETDEGRDMGMAEYH